MKTNPANVWYVDPNSLLVINREGAMRQVFTPFRVQCTRRIENITLGVWVYVDAVYPHGAFRLLFQVGGKLYPYHYFHVQILF